MIARRSLEILPFGPQPIAQVVAADPTALAIQLIRAHPNLFFRRGLALDPVTGDVVRHAGLRRRPLPRSLHCRLQWCEYGVSKEVYRRNKAVRQGVACARFAVRRNFSPTETADARSRSPSRSTSWVGWDVGYMTNRDSTHAIGWSLHAGGSGGGTRLAAKARRRTWVTIDNVRSQRRSPDRAEQAADLSGTKSGYCLTAETAIGAYDLAGVMLDADVTRVQSRNAAAIYVGDRLGSHAAVGATVIALAGVIALYQARSAAATRVRRSKSTPSASNTARSVLRFPNGCGFIRVAAISGFVEIAPSCRSEPFPPNQ